MFYRRDLGGREIVASKNTGSAALTKTVFRLFITSHTCHMDQYRRVVVRGSLAQRSQQVAFLLVALSAQQDRFQLVVFYLMQHAVGTQEEVVSPSDIRRADYRRHTTVSIRIFRFHTSGDDIALRMVDALFRRNDAGTHHGVDQRMVFRAVNDALPRANLIDAAIPDVRHHAPTLMETDEGHRRTHVLRASTCLGIESLVSIAKNFRKFLLTKIHSLQVQMFQGVCKRLANRRACHLALLATTHAITDDKKALLPADDILVGIASILLIFSLSYLTERIGLRQLDIHDFFVS